MMSIYTFENNAEKLAIFLIQWNNHLPYTHHLTNEISAIIMITVQHDGRYCNGETYPYNSTAFNLGPFPH